MKPSIFPLDVIAVIRKQIFRWLRIEIGIISALDYGAKQDGTIQNEAVQRALNALPENATLVVPPGIYFSKKALIYPKNGFMHYIADYQLDPPAYGTQLASGELVRFSFNSSFSDDNPGGGQVNELRFSSTRHTGLMLTTFTDVLGHDAYDGPLQDREIQALVSANWLFDDVNIFTGIAKNKKDGSIFDGVYFHGFRREITLTGIGSTSWTVPPIVGDQLVGVDSDARGTITEITTTTIKVVWKRKRFLVNETVRYGATVSTAPISAITYLTQTTPALMFDLINGNIAIDLPATTVTEKFAVGGLIVSSLPRDSGQFSYKTMTEVGFAYYPTFENTLSGLRTVIDTSIAATSARIVARKRGSNENLALVTAVRLLTNFTNAVTSSGSAFNVAGISRLAQGDYSIDPIVDFAVANPTISLSKTEPTDDPFVYVTSTSAVRIRNSDANHTYQTDTDVDLPNIVAGTAHTFTVPVTGAPATAIGFLGAPVSLGGLIVAHTEMSAAATLQITLLNPTAADINLGVTTFPGRAKGVGTGLKDLTGRVHVVATGGDIPFVL